jgi:anti-sigma B factor antagonist
MSANPAAPAPQLKIDTEKTSTRISVHCAGRITSTTSDLLRSTVRPLIPESQYILLDLTDVSFLDSSGLGTIIGLWVAAKKAHHELRLSNANQRIINLFLMSNLAAILEGRNEYLGLTPD